MDQPHLLIVEARFYAEIADEMYRGAEAVLRDRNATIDRIEVPGAFEIPGAIRLALKSMELVGGRRRYDAFVGLGCVIRGETTHYDYVCTESARGLMDLAVNHAVALGYGILTCENKDQAWARAAVDQGNKGAKAAEAALAMLDIKSRLGFYPR